MNYDDDEDYKTKKKKKGGKYRNWKWISKEEKIEVFHPVCRGEDTTTYGCNYPWLQPGTEKGDAVMDYYGIPRENNNESQNSNDNQQVNSFLGGLFRKPKRR